MKVYVYVAYSLTLLGLTLFAGITWLTLKKARQTLSAQSLKERNASQS